MGDEVTRSGSARPYDPSLPGAGTAGASDAAGKTGKTKAAAKTGRAKAKAPAPPAPPPLAPGKTSQSVDEKLGPLLRYTSDALESGEGLDADGLLELIESLRTKTRDAQVELARRGIESHRVKLKAQHDKTISQLKKSDDKQAQSDTGSKVAEALTWVAFALAMLVAIITAIVSFGAGSAAIGAVALIGAAIAITVTVLNETGAMDKITDGLGEGMEEILKACGVDPKEAKRIGKIVAQVLVGIELCLAAFTGGSSMGEAVEEITSTVARVSAQVALKAVQAGQIAGAAVTMGADSASLAAGVYESEALNLTAEAMDDKAIIKKLEAAMERDQKFIKELIELIESSRQATNDALESGHKTRMKIITGSPALA